MATPRRLLVDPARSGVFHCVSRCVRRAFLCGRDSDSGRNFEHRRGWIRDRLRELAGLFAVEVHSYAVMSNHLHVVVRTLAQLVSGWDDEEVARRWLWLFPGRGGIPGRAPEEDAIRALCLDRRRLASCRNRLADLSWFMRCLELLDWTGRQVRSGKRGAMSSHLRPALERLDLDVDAWVDNVERFGGLFWRVAGKLRRLRDRALAIGQASVHGHAGARRLYARAG